MTTVQNDHQLLNASIAFDGKPASPASVTETAMAVMMEVMKYRRMSGTETCSADALCAACMAPHLPKIVAKVEQQQPITFVLPAFPGKSPNQAKVLGTLPDMAERRALEFLQQLCERIGRIYEPGAQIILASDGRVFSDLIGIRDQDVSAYRNEISELIKDLGLTNLTTFNLEVLYLGVGYDEMRRHFMEEFGESLDDMRAAVRRVAEDADASDDDREIHRLLGGITRFLVEDATFPGQTKSRNALQKECRVRAYEVVQRSQAWGGVVEDQFPDAVRLSIHPQDCGSKKLGIQLSEPPEADNWLTPWHAVAVEMEDGRFKLIKRSQAEALGARLVTINGRPSHYTLEG
jgi:pyoverdine/dityrosine biosynthesis protein Dit1